jgi:hypothetical protein
MAMETEELRVMGQVRHELPVMTRWKRDRWSGVSSF